MKSHLRLLKLCNWGKQLKTERRVREGFTAASAILAAFSFGHRCTYPWTFSLAQQWHSYFLKWYRERIKTLLPFIKPVAITESPAQYSSVSYSLISQDPSFSSSFKDVDTLIQAVRGSKEFYHLSWNHLKLALLPFSMFYFQLVTRKISSVFTEEETHYQNLDKIWITTDEIYFYKIRIVMFANLKLFQEECQHHKMQETIMRSPFACVVAP